MLKTDKSIIKDLTEILGECEEIGTQSSIVAKVATILTENDNFIEKITSKSIQSYIPRPGDGG